MPKERYTPYHNQKVIRFVNAKKDIDHPYTMFNKEALRGAISNLSVNAFKLYIYMGSFKEIADDKSKELKTFNLSRKNATEVLNISDSSYHKAVKELISKNYIAPDSARPGKDNYTFIENGLCI